MNNSRMKRGQMKAPSKSVTAQAVWNGWEDYRNGRGYSKEYETYDETLQRCYELGRMYAAACRLACGTVPYWKRNSKLRAPNDAAMRLMREQYEFQLSGRKYHS